MDTIQLRCFKTAAKYESVTKAAEELFIPQPTVSKQIHNVESELGYQLFTRRGKHIYLNENGKLFLKYLNKCSGLMQDCRKELVDNNECLERSVSLLVTSCSKMLPDILQKFRDLHPQIKIFINQSNTPDSDADLCLFSKSEGINSPSCVQLLREDICLAVPFGDLLTFQSCVTFDKLKNERFIMLKPESNLRKVIDPFFQKHKFCPNIIMEVENPSLLRELISSGFGISVVPSITWGDTSTMQAKLLPFEEVGLGRSIYLSWDSSRYLSRSARQLRDFIEDYFADIDTPQLM